MKKLQTNAIRNFLFIYRRFDRRSDHPQVNKS